MKVDFEGLKVELPDDFSSDEIASALEGMPKPKKLLSAEGVGSTLKMIGPGLVRGIVGTQLADLEQVQSARDKRRLTEPDLPEDDDEKETKESIRLKRQMLKEIEGDISQIRGEPSKPLEIAQGVTQSVASNLPGVSVAVLSRGAGGAAALPALQSAYEQSAGQAYADAIAKGAKPEDALKHSQVSAAAEAGFEVLPTSWLIKNVGKMGAVEFVSKYLARELATELPTTATQKISERLNVEPDKPLREFMSELGNELMDTALTVPFSAGMTGMVAHGIQKAGESGKSDAGVPPPPAPGGPSPAPTQPGDNAQLTPAFDQPTTQVDSKTKSDLDALIASIDADLIDDKQVEEAKKVVAAYEEKRKAPPIEGAEIAWSSVATAPTSIEDVGELGASAKQTANAQNYINPNTGDRLDRPISYGPEDEVGKTLRQITPKPATYVIGQATEDRPADMLQAMQETVESWRQQYMPESTIVVSNEQLFTNSALGWHYTVGDKTHVIVPAVLRKATKGLGAFNTNTQAGVFYNLTHEFGHALIADKFLEGVTPELGQQMRAEMHAGLVSEQTLQALPEPQAAVIREYNAIKAAVLNNSMTASQFVDTWFSPAKLGRKTLLSDLGVAPNDNAMAVVKATVQRAVRNTPESKGRRALQQKLLSDFLSLDEYLAEQTARFAYQRQWDQQSALGKFFKAALDSLRKLFNSLKKDQIIAPGTAFQEWLDGMSKGLRPAQEGERIAETKKKGKTAPKAKAKKAAKARAKKVEKVQHNAESETLEQYKEKAMRMLTTLELSEAISEDEARKLYDLIERNEWDAFLDEFQKHAPKNVKFELKGDEEADWAQVFSQDLSVLKAGMSELEARLPSRMAEAAAEWKEKQFRSKFFKAWFGDWENDPEGSSKIRRGQLIATPGSLDFAATPSSRDNTNGAPLVVYHATRAAVPGPFDFSKKVREPFFKFSRGDLGFHFGTLRAAHVRGYLLTAHQWGPDYTDGRDIPNEKAIDVTVSAATKLLAGKTPSTDLETDLKRRGSYEGLYIIPTVLNLRNPLYIGEENLDIWGNTNMLSFLRHKGIISLDEENRVTVEMKMLQTRFQTPEVDSLPGFNPTYEINEPIRQLLVSKGFDGLVYQNIGEGDLSYVAFHPNQVKSLLGSRTFSRSDNLHMELDYDAATPEGHGASSLYKSVKNFVSDPGPLRRALRKASFFFLELQQLAHLNPDVSELTYMAEENTNYNRRKSSLQAPADAVVHTWADLGKENDSKVSRILFEERDSGQLWFDLVREAGVWKYAVSAKTLEEFKKRGVDTTTPEGEELTKLVLDAKNALMFQLNGLEQSLITALQNRYAGAGPDVMKAAIIPLKRHVHELRKAPFFPQGRFGNYIVTVEKKRANAPGNDVVYREAFESRADWLKAGETAQAKASVDEKVRMHELTDSQYVMMALPLDFVDLAASELGLNDQQVEQLMQILQPIKTEKAFRKYDEARLGLKGYSTDAMRSFANFTWHNANMIAKLEYRSKFNLAIRGVGLRLRTAQYAGPEQAQEVERLGRVKSYMERTRDYIMSPPYEAQAIRAVVSVAYLGLNIKTAVINFYGLITTWSDLTTRYGQLEGNARFLRAVKQGASSFKLTDLNTRREGDYLPAETQTALDRAIEEGVLSQSYAYHLAGFANAGNLWRLPARRAVGRHSQNLVDFAMWPFRVMELATRRITFLAEFEAAQKEENLGMSDAYTTAVQRTNKLQNDYSTGNRAPFLRGIKTQPGNPFAKVVEPAVPLATVFMTFMQHMAFHAYGGYELGERRLAKQIGEAPRSALGGYTMKIWLVTLLLAGYEGLPGAENLLDLVEALWRKVGGQKPIRQELREFIQSVDGDPQLWARGLGHNVAGFDVSRSLGLGRVFPGTDVLAHPRDNIAESVGTLALDMAGPTGAFLKFGLEAVFGNKPPAQAFERLPGGLGNMWVAYRWSQQGVRSPSGAQITHDLETGKLRDLTTEEILGKALGFNPTIVAQNREIRFAQYDRKIYWQTRRDILLDSWWTANWQKDREAQADTRKAISEFNSSVPASYKDLRVTGADLARSVQARNRVKRLEENQMTPQRKYRSLYEDVKKSFEQP